MPPIEVSEQAPLTCPYFNLALLQCQELLLFVQEDKCFGRGETRCFTRCSILAVNDLQGVASRLEHNALIELLKELDLSSSLVKGNLHEYLARVHIDECHRNAIGLDHV